MYASAACAGASWGVLRPSADFISLHSFLAENELALPGKKNKRPCAHKRVRKVGRFSVSTTSRTLFVHVYPRPPGSRAALPAAGHGGQRTPNIIQPDTLPALRFAGTPGITTSRDRVVGASSTSLASGFAKNSLIPLLLLSPQSHSTLRGPHYYPTPRALA